MRLVSKTQKIIVVLIALATITCMLVVGCTSQITEANENEVEVNHLSPNMFVLMNIAKRVDSAQAVETLKALHQSVSVQDGSKRGNEGIDPTIRFIVENIYNIFDMSIINAIIEEANIKYGNSQIPTDPMSLNALDSFLGHIGERADMGIDGFEFSLLNLYLTPQGKGYNQNDFDHAYNLITKLSNQNIPLNEVVDYIDLAIANTNHTDAYMTIIEQAISIVSFISKNQEELSECLTMRFIAATGLLVELNYYGEEITDDTIRNIIAFNVSVLGSGGYLSLVLGSGGGIEAARCIPMSFSSPTTCWTHHNRWPCFNGIGSSDTGSKN